MFFIYVALIVAAVYFFTGRNERYADYAPKRNLAIDTLTERFVNGEIDEEQYEKMKRAIRG